MKIGFIGLGLIGGSIAKTIHKRYPEAELVACDLNLDNLQLAEEENLICSSCQSLDSSFSCCDYIFLCTPVHTNTMYLDNLKQYLTDTTILTDVGSVKNDISEMIKSHGLSHCFIGGHPMAGSEKTGFQNASDHLIENAYYLITPGDEVKASSIEAFRHFIETLGALPLVLTPEKHDYITAAISHVPHVIASSLVNLIKEQDESDGAMKLIAAGGFKDITRIASSSPVMWEQICMTNKANISKLLTDYIHALEAIQEKIIAGSEKEIYSFFDEAREYRNSFIDSSFGPIKKVHVLYCDIIDESGAIATIATILATGGISIKNIGIVHNREFEEGALRIEFYDDAALEKANALLTRHRYVIYERK